MDERGAMMTVGAFMAVFLVGVLYVVAAAGESAVYQESLQDTADQAAFSAAATHAEAMNAVANVQATMVVTQSAVAGFQLAVLASKLCHTFGIIQTGIDEDGNGVDDFCDDLLEQHASNRDAAVPELYDALREGSRTARDIVERTPTLAATEAERVARERSGARIRRVFIVPRPMAVRASGNSALCALANLTSFRLAEITMGVDMVERLLGRGDSRVYRELPHCPEIEGVDAFVSDPPARPPATESYQVRAIIVGDASALASLGAGVRVPHDWATREGDLSRADMAGVDRSSTLVTAQAEYYSSFEHAGLAEDTETHSVDEEFLRMDWHARLRRFRYPTGGAVDPVEMDSAYRAWLADAVLPACGPDCDRVRDALEGANDALH